MMTVATPPQPSSGTQPAGRWFIAIGFVLSSLFTAGLGIGGQKFMADYQARQNDKLTKVAAFEGQTGKLVSFIAELNRALRLGKDLRRPKQEVLSNLQDQFRTLSDAMPYVSEGKLPEAQHYLAVIGKLVEEVEQLDELHHAGPYAQQWVCLALAQNDVVDDLRRSAGLRIAERSPSIATPEVCRS